MIQRILKGVKRYGWEVLALILLSYVPVFHNLGRLPLRIWDETRQAFNALEMAEHGHWLALYFEGQPDFWNVKTPLMVILQALSVKAFGWTEFALRLPSGLAALATVFLLYFWMRPYLKQRLFAFGAIALLLSFKGYVDFHSIRTGDMDSLLTFFMLAYSYCLFRWVENGNSRNLLGFFLFLFLAFFTKSIAAMLLLPALLLYVLLNRKLGELLKTRTFWLYSLILLLIPAYYIYRDQVNPGYWASVLKEELGGRYIDGKSDNRSIWYYLHQQLTRDMGYYLLMLIPGALLILHSDSAPKRRLGMLAYVCILGHQAVLMGSSTKFGWYDMPEFPFYALLFALLMDALFYDQSFRNWSPTAKWKETVFALLILILTALPLYMVRAEEIASGRELENGNDYYGMSAFLQRHARNNPHGLDGLVFPQEGYHWWQTYYVRRINRAGGNLVAKPMEEIEVGDRIVTGSQYVVGELEKKFFMKRLEVEGSVEVYEVRQGNGRSN